MLLSSTALNKALKTHWKLHSSSDNNKPEMLNECLVLNFSGKFLYDQTRMELKTHKGKLGDRFFLKKRSMLMGKPGDWKELNIGEFDTIILSSGSIVAGVDKYVNYRTAINRSFYTPVVYPHPISAQNGFNAVAVTKRDRSKPTSETLVISADANIAVLAKDEPACLMGFRRLSGALAPVEVENDSKHFYPTIYS